MNPYDMRSNLNSATGGAVAAAAAGLAAATVGVEADAATTGTGNPSNGASMSALVGAAFGGAVAMRPTLGTVPNAGILPSARSQETAAPVGRSVSDVTSTLEALAGATSRSASPR